eukprot:396351-Rhodomonas_salina.5
MTELPMVLTGSPQGSFRYAPTRVLCGARYWLCYAYAVLTGQYARPSTAVLTQLLFCYYQDQVDGEWQLLCSDLLECARGTSQPMLLRVCYQMSGTDAHIVLRDVWYGRGLSSYVLAPRCPVLTNAMLLPSATRDLRPAGSTSYSHYYYALSRTKATTDSLALMQLLTLSGAICDQASSKLEPLYVELDPSGEGAGCVSLFAALCWSGQTQTQTPLTPQTQTQTQTEPQTQTAQDKTPPLQTVAETEDEATSTEPERRAWTVQELRRLVAEEVRAHGSEHGLECEEEEELKTIVDAIEKGAGEFSVFFFFFCRWLCVVRLAAGGMWSGGGDVVMMGWRRRIGRRFGRRLRRMFRSWCLGMRMRRSQTRSARRAMMMTMTTMMTTMMRLTRRRRRRRMDATKHAMAQRVTPCGSKHNQNLAAA